MSDANNGMTSDALRKALDSGKGADKVNFPDPAAAPLGTDDEAAGTPPTPQQRAMAAQAEVKQPKPKPAVFPVWPLILLAIALLILLAIWL